MPGARGAAGAAIVGGKLYVVGGVGPNGLARRAFALDLKTGRWASIPGPTPREHLAVTAAAGQGLRGGRAAGGHRHEPPRLRVVFPGHEALDEAAAGA